MFNYFTYLHMDTCSRWMWNRCLVSKSTHKSFCTPWIRTKNTFFSGRDFRVPQESTLVWAPNPGKKPLHSDMFDFDSWYLDVSCCTPALRADVSTIWTETSDRILVCKPIKGECLGRSQKQQEATIHVSWDAALWERHSDLSNEPKWQTDCPHRLQCQRKAL